MALSSNQISAKLRELWAKLNSDPTTRARKTSPHWVVLQWGAEGVMVVEAMVGDPVQLRDVSEIQWGPGDDPQDSPLQAGIRLREHFASRSISATQVAVVVPRQVAVIRRLEIPDVPEAELPDVVRFQAAARTSSPLERLALDYVPSTAQATGPRVVLLVTMEAARLRSIQAAVEASGRELMTVAFSPLTTAELLGRSATGQSEQPAVVVWQKDDNVELSLIDGKQLSFSHNIQLSAEEGEAHVKPLQAELTRALVAMSQQGAGATIERAYLIPGLASDPAVRGLLEKRFGEGLSLVDPADHANLSSLPEADQSLVARCGPALGELVALHRATLPAIDFLNPRKRYVAPNRRKEQMRLAGGAAALMLVLGVWWYLSAMGSRQAEIDRINEEIGALKVDIDAGTPAREQANKLTAWRKVAPDPAPVLARFYKYLPETKDLYFNSLKVEAGARDENAVASIVGTLYARNDAIIEALQDELRARGYKEYEPQVIHDAATVDPDYPREYLLKVNEFPLPPSQPPAVVASGS